jgi:hypothetical protein
VRRAAVAQATAAVALALAAGCTSSADKPDALDDTAGAGLRLGGDQPSASEAARDTALGRALAAVPASVLYASFTDLDAVRARLGYADVDSSSPAGERFAFWEAARAEGTMLTGARLYDDIAVMADDYGWTADDVAWEVDFSGNETGCTEDMICDPSGGAVLALRPDLDSRLVVGSLVDNGFDFHSADQLWTARTPGEPFDRAVYLPRLNALALGNAIGLIRVVDVAGGAPSLADEIPTLASTLADGSPESAYVDTTGCVSLGEALGPDASEQDLAGYLTPKSQQGLAAADSWAVAIDSDVAATSYLSVEVDGSTQGADAARSRAAVIAAWHSLQSGLAFDDVASAQVAVDGPIERASFDVADMPAFAAMVLDHDAPWALCPPSPT